MGALESTRVSLRVFGDELDPQEVTDLLGCPPTRQARKGDLRPSGHAERTNGWWLRADKREPGDLNAQISEILARLTNDMTIWSDLKTRFRMELFCGLFMRSANDGLRLPAETLAAIGDRGIDLDLDIYGSDEDRDE